MKIQASQFTTTIHFNDKVIDLPFGKRTFLDELYVDYEVEELSNGWHLKAIVHPKEDVVLQDFKVVFPFDFGKVEQVFCNGFQSWSESRLYDKKERIDQLKWFAKSKLAAYGDTNYKLVNRKKGNLHSWTYGYVPMGKDCLLMGSLKENTAFTLVQYDTNTNEISIQKDVDGLALKHSFPILDIVILRGQENKVFDQYFGLMDIEKPKAPLATGWTSWYNYYTNINEQILLDNLEAFSTKDQAIDIFQIDDGWQVDIGDWLNVRPSFNGQLETVAQAIHAKSMRAGIWVAPFICESKSQIFQHKKAWLLKDSNGNPVKAGYTPLWSGDFFALDFYNNEVQTYLTQVFHFLLQKKGFDMVKLDFLYAVCLCPPPHKTRGQVMYDAMQFLRNLVGDKLILACGVPLGSSFGLVDYCRIGADIHLKWEHGLLKFLGNRERVSTILCLRNTLGRWQLNGRAFGNDPDVILLRDTNIKLTPTQQYTVLIINTLLGNVLFTSDNLDEYNDEQLNEYQSINYWKGSAIQQVELVRKDVYVIHFKKGNQRYKALANLTSKRQVVEGVELEAFESMVVR